MSSAAAAVACATPPAKLNLFLELLGRRDDGFHELDTVMVPIDWYDRLRVTRRSAAGVALRAAWLPAAGTLARRLAVAPGSDAVLGLPEPQSNLVHRALTAFVRHYRVSGGFDAELGKRIPAGAGMGGASSDAAAALSCAARLCGVPRSDPGLAEIAAELGSDVPFFLGAGGRRLRAARARGRGEQIEPVQLGAPLSAVVVYPNRPLSTASVYRACDVLSEPLRAEPLLDALRRGCLRSIAPTIVNRLSAPALALAPQIAEILGILWKSGLTACQLTGSGSACFGLARSAREARRIAGALRGQLEPGALVRATRTISVPPPVSLQRAGSRSRSSRS